MKLVLDTNAYAHCDAGLEAALTSVERAELLFLPTIVYGELYYGFRNGTRWRSNLERLHAFIEQFDVTMIPVDADVARKYGDIFAGLRRAGTPVPMNDVWIAACAMAVGATVLTADAHFLQIPQIQVEHLEIKSTQTKKKG
jgi:tRNA(fMet)-specific endonuclease VapC